MPTPRIGLPPKVLQAPDAADVTQGLGRIRTELQVPGAFGPEVIEAAVRDCLAYVRRWVA